LKITQVLVSVFLQNLFEKLFHMAKKFSFGEGASLNKPPLLCGQNYPIQIFLLFTSLEIPLLRTSSGRQKSKGDKGSPCSHL